VLHCGQQIKYNRRKQTKYKRNNDEKIVRAKTQEPNRNLK
jgi:hypothetical protein